MKIKEIKSIKPKHSYTIEELCAKNKMPNRDNLVDEEEEQRKKERSKPSVERRNTPNEKKYNEFVSRLRYKKKKY